MAPMWPDAEGQDNNKAVADLLNEAKNAAKHKRGHGDNWIEIDPKYESGEVIERAISTLKQIKDVLHLKQPHQLMAFHHAYLEQKDE